MTWYKFNGVFKFNNPCNFHKLFNNNYKPGTQKNFNKMTFGLICLCNNNFGHTDFG